MELNLQSMLKQVLLYHVIYMTMEKKEERGQVGGGLKI